MGSNWTATGCGIMPCVNDTPTAAVPPSQALTVVLSPEEHSLAGIFSKVLLGSIVFLLACFAFCGVVRPLWTGSGLYCYSAQRRAERKRAQSKSMPALQATCAFLLAAITAAIWGASVARGESWWTVLKDWTLDGTADAPGVSTYIEFSAFMLILNWDAIFLLLFTLFVRWPSQKDAEQELLEASAMAASQERTTNGEGMPWAAPKSQPQGAAPTPADHAHVHVDVPSDAVRRKKGRPGHAFIIACHNSSEKIRATIENILRRSEPWQVFVADNGSTPREVEATERVCKALSIEYNRAHPEYEGLPVNFGSLPEGSKTVAQFSTAFNLRFFPKKIAYVTMIDDDTIVPEAWCEDVIAAYFADPAVACIAYPLCALNRNACALPCFQDIEYRMAGFSRYVASRFGTALFASGAFNTWRLEIIVDILFRHDTMHHGDDLQQGLILHSLAGRKWVLNPSRRHPKAGYKVACAAEVVVGTDVPFCWMHPRDLVPDFLKKHVSWGPCECGEPSLFLQRGKGWDVSRQRFLLKYLRMIVRVKAIRSWRTFWARVLAIQDVVLIVNDWAALAYGILILASYSNRLFFAQGLIVSWAFHALTSFVFDALVLRRSGAAAPPEALVLFTMLYKVPLLLFVRTYGMFFNILYYAVFVRNKARIEKRYRGQAPFKKMVSTAYLRPPTKDETGEDDGDVIVDPDRLARIIEAHAHDVPVSVHLDFLQRKATRLDRELRAAAYVYYALSKVRGRVEHNMDDAAGDWALPREPEMPEDFADDVEEQDVEFEPPRLQRRFSSVLRLDKAGHAKEKAELPKTAVLDLLAQTAVDEGMSSNSMPSLPGPPSRWASAGSLAHSEASLSPSGHRPSDEHRRKNSIVARLKTASFTEQDAMRAIEKFIDESVRTIEEETAAELRAAATETERELVRNELVRKRSELDRFANGSMRLVRQYSRRQPIPLAVDGEGASSTTGTEAGPVPSILVTESDLVAGSIEGPFNAGHALGANGERLNTVTMASEANGRAVNDGAIAEVPRLAAGNDVAIEMTKMA